MTRTRATLLILALLATGAVHAQFELTSTTPMQVSFGGEPLVGAGSYDVFLAKYGP